MAKQSRNLVEWVDSRTYFVVQAVPSLVHIYDSETLEELKPRFLESIWGMCVLQGQNFKY